MCGAIALVSALVVIAMDAGKSSAEFPYNLAEQAFVVSGNLFMWLGVVLLIPAIGRLRHSWHRLFGDPIPDVQITAYGVGPASGLPASTFMFIPPHFSCSFG